MTHAKIATHFNFDPPDDPNFTWEAWFGGVPNSPKGFGSTEQAAIDDLLPRDRKDHPIADRNLL